MLPVDEADHSILDSETLTAAATADQDLICMYAGKFSAPRITRSAASSP